MIDVAKILTRLGIVYDEVGHDYRTACWFHEENHPSMSINKEGGYYHCFSCQRSGNIFTMLDDFLNLSGVEALHYLSNFDAQADTEEEEAERYDLMREKFEKRNSDQPSLRIIVHLPQHRLIESHPYLEKRGFNSSEILEWGMGEVEEKPYVGWIIIPIYQGNKLRNYFMRSPYNSRKLYGKYPRKDILVGIATASDIDKPIYVVEGIFDMIFLRRAGVQVVASLSNRIHSELLTPLQLAKLKEYKHVVIVPDADNPGLQLVKDAIPLLNAGVKVGVCTLPEGKKDTAECTVRELFMVINNEQSILDFISQERYILWQLNNLQKSS